MAGNKLVTMWNECDKHERLMFLRVLCRLFGDEVREELGKASKEAQCDKRREKECG